MARYTSPILDWLTVFISFYIAKGLNHHISDFLGMRSMEVSPAFFLLLTISSATIFLLIFLWQGVYQLRNNSLSLEDSRRTIRSSFMAYGLMVLPSFYMHDKYDARVFITIAILIVMILLLMQKSLTALFLYPRLIRSFKSKRLLILGTEQNPDLLLNKVLGIWTPGYIPVGFLTNDRSTIGQSLQTSSAAVNATVPVIDEYASAKQLIKDLSIEELWINDPYLSRNEIQEIFESCRENGVRCFIVASLGEGYDIPVEAVNLGGVVVIREKQVYPRPLFTFTKRLTDIAGSIVLLALLSPLLLIVSLWIKLDSTGPVLFKQNRCGKNGKTFRMFKFRTMTVDTEPYSVSPPDQNDSRITNAGRVLRKSSFDEVPQLLNVLIGNMSLVGPRPEMPFIVEQYNRYQEFRLSIKPGITGLWQISADRKHAIHKNLDYDFYYIDNRSLILDLIILWRTLWTALKGI